MMTYMCKFPNMCEPLRNTQDNLAAARLALAAEREKHRKYRKRVRDALGCDIDEDVVTKARWYVDTVARLVKRELDLEETLAAERERVTHKENIIQTVKDERNRLKVKVCNLETVVSKRNADLAAERERAERAEAEIVRLTGDDPWCRADGPQCHARAEVERLKDALEQACRKYQREVAEVERLREKNAEYEYERNALSAEVEQLQEQVDDAGATSAEGIFKARIAAAVEVLESLSTHVETPALACWLDQALALLRGEKGGE